MKRRRNFRFDIVLEIPIKSGANLFEICVFVIQIFEDKRVNGNAFIFDFDDRFNVRSRRFFCTRFHFSTP